MIRYQPLALAAYPVAKVANAVKAAPKDLVSKKFFMITTKVRKGVLSGVILPYSFKV